MLMERAFHILIFVPFETFLNLFSQNAFVSISERSDCLWQEYFVIVIRN